MTRNRLEFTMVAMESHYLVQDVVQDSNHDANLRRFRKVFCATQARDAQ